MKLVEQAIFTWVETERDSGYRVAASSPGVCEADAHELAVWAPSRDAMIDMGPESESFNFHPLPSGAHCVSRTTGAGWEAGGGQRLYTHCLIVPIEILARFANNPLGLARAISDRGLWQYPGVPCPRLAAFCLPGGTATVDQTLLNQLAADPGSSHMAALVQAARDAVCLAVAGTDRPVVLIEGLFSCLPPECRLEFSFSTGLKFSPRRPFRLVALSDDPAERLWIANYPNVTVLDLGKASPRSMPLDGWSRLIQRTLATGHTPYLAAQISKRRFDLSPDDLPALGLQLLEGLDASECRGDDAEGELPVVRSSLVPGRAHAPHRQFEKSIEAAAATLSHTAPPTHLDIHSPKVLEKLERLDDLVYEAISGQAGSLEELQRAWPAILSELGDEMLAESRQQYLRYALSIWDECAETGGIRNPARAIQALEVLCLLFGDAT